MMKIADIQVGSRARQVTGWLDDLQRSIEALGVLQPIGVTPSNELIFGYRRLMACKALGFEEIPARVIDVSADDPVTALRMEQAENEVRKDFTASEKVEIARRIEEALGKRQGQRSDLGKSLHKSEPEGKSRDLAAESVGWSGETYRKAKSVVDSGNEEAKDAMDSGEASVHKAYTQTRKPKQEKAPEKTWKVTIDFDSKKQMFELADRIVEEAEMEVAIAVAERILKRYGSVEVKQ